MRSRGFNGFLTQRQGPLDFEVRYKAEFSGWPSERLTLTSARLIIGSASPNLFVACNSLARLLRSVATSGCSGYNFSHLRPAPGASTARPPPAGS
jgi:hypothetical protein